MGKQFVPVEERVEGVRARSEWEGGADDKTEEGRRGLDLRCFFTREERT
jgi:hypothetical protein